MPAPLPGIHHVTAITSDGQRNIDFYVGVLGLRLVKKTVNFDVPDTYHLYYGDWLGTPGTTMTFFVWPQLSSGPPGTGQVTAASFAVPGSSLGFWEERLGAHGVAAVRDSRFGEDVLSFHDPDGVQLELLGTAPPERWTPWGAGAVPVPHAIRGFHSVTLTVARHGPTVGLLEETMGFGTVAADGARVRLSTAGGGAGSLVDVVEAPQGGIGQEAAGTVHHVAWRALDDDHQLAWREALLGAGMQVTPVIDRTYFHSIYYRERGGVLFEVATDLPGFAVDEHPQAFGFSLKLPPQYEAARATLERQLPPLVVPDIIPAASGPEG